MQSLLRLPFISPSLSTATATLPPFRQNLPSQRINGDDASKNFKPFRKQDSQHELRKQTLFHFNLYLQLHVNAGELLEARSLFEEMPEKTLVSWTILMSGYVKHGRALQALLMFNTMLCAVSVQLQLDSYVYAVALKACGKVGNLRFGHGIHGQMRKRNFVVDSFVENALIKMYADCGSLIDAVYVFDKIENPDLVAWSSMMSAYCRNGSYEEGLMLFLDMIHKGIGPDEFILSVALGACVNLPYLKFGAQVHCYITKMGFQSCLFLENVLLDFYAKSGDLEAMELVFFRLAKKNLVSWNTLISGFVYNSYFLEALRCFRVMVLEVNQIDHITIVNILKAVAGLGEVRHSREVHAHIIRVGLDSNHFVISSLLDTYMSSDYDCSDVHELVPLKLFNHIEGEFDEFIITSMLRWCASQSNLDIGEVFHSLIIKLDFMSDPFVISALIDMYCKCGILEAAERVFSRVKDPDTSSWSAIISGSSWNGVFEEALVLFRKMQFDCVKANEFTLTSALLACLAMNDLRKGREVHCKILRAGYNSDASVINTLVNLYSELSHHKQALKVCLLIPDSEISWKYLIQSGLRNRDYETVHELLRRIQICSGALDIHSARDILNSCSNLVSLNVGTQAHAYMVKRGLTEHPTISNSLIRMYSACGRIDDATLTFNLMHEKNSISWASMISARVDHGYASEALNLFSQVRWKNKSTDPSILSSYLRACGHMGLVDEAYRLFTTMEEVYGVKVSEEHYSCMVEVLGRAGFFEEAQELVRGISTQKLGPLFWKTLLSSCRLHGNMEVAKYAIEKLLELKPSDLSAPHLLGQVLLTLGNWTDASKLNISCKPKGVNFSWIEIRNKIYEFASDESPSNEISEKLADFEKKMEELGYVADKNHMLHNAEEEEYDGAGIHTEMKALVFGFIVARPGSSLRVIKSIRMCGDCHSACKFISTFVNRELIVKDPCTFHHFKHGKCSCRDKW